MGGSLELEAGNFGELKAKGMVNVPLGEQFAMRFSGISYSRDGITHNVFTNNDVDGRDQWAARGAFRFSPSENTDATLTVNYYKEDSSRSRVGKQMCHRDPAGNFGCLPDSLAFEAQNARATLGGSYGELLPLVIQMPQIALITAGVDINQGVYVPQD